MSGFLFSLGFKLPLDWREQQRRGAIPPPDIDVYSLLHKLGFDYVEFGVGPCQHGEELSRLHREVEACCKQGLGVALHPYLSGSDNSTFFGITPESEAAVRSVIKAASSTAASSGRKVSLVLHPAECFYEMSDRDVFHSEMLQRSKLFFAEIKRQADESRGEVEPFAEHQVPPTTGERIIRIGDTYMELLDVITGIGLRICWDTGHYILSVERHGQDEEPSTEFLDRVGCVHLHDVVDVQDHRLITPNSDRPRRYLTMLLHNGFTGGVTLEYSLESIRSVGGVEETLRSSVEVLSDWARAWEDKWACDSSITEIQ